MTRTQKIDHHIKQLNRLGRGDKYVYHNSGDIRFKDVFEAARFLSDRGQVTLTQKRLPDNTTNYIATGRWSDLDRKRAMAERGGK